MPIYSGYFYRIYDYEAALPDGTFSPTSGREVKKNTVTDVVTDVKSFEIGSKWLL
jgi:excinuclease ABC subunit A